VRSAFALVKDGDLASLSDFDPIPALNLSDADVHLAILTNMATYTGGSTDPWIGTVNHPVGNNTEGYRYAPTNSVTILACAQQYRVFKLNSGGTAVCIDYAGTLNS
jgi:hypothetical protein